MTSPQPSQLASPGTATGSAEIARLRPPYRLQPSPLLPTSVRLELYRQVWSLGSLCLQEAAMGFEQQALSALAANRATGILIRQVEAELLEGWALAEIGEAEKGIAQMQASIGTWLRLGARIGNPNWYGWLASGFLRAGRLGDAREALEAGLVAAKSTNERWWEAELHRQYGELLLAADAADVQAVQSRFHEAIEVARRQGARSLELRAAKSLASLWQGQGKRKEAYELLAPIYNWFTEGSDTRDLKEAKALLEELV